MPGKPAFQFYPGDWLKDTNLRVCSPAARGVYIDILCLMDQAEKRGILRVKKRAISLKKLSKSIAGCTPKLIVELIENGVLAQSERTGTFYSKRMLREELHRRHAAQNGSRGGKAKASKTLANTVAKPGSSSSPSSSSSKNTNTPPTPQRKKKPAFDHDGFDQILDGSVFDESAEVRGLFHGWLDERSILKKPLTKRAAEGAVRRLSDYPPWWVKRRLEDAISNGWQGLTFSNDPQPQDIDHGPKTDSRKQSQAGNRFGGATDPSAGGYQPSREAL
jgi:hypothetical protein